MIQYRQRVDESVAVCRPQIVPGWRGHARPFHHQSDPLIEPALGPILETNGGFRWSYTPQRTRAWAQVQPVLHVYVNGNDVSSYRFKSKPIAEISTSTCS